jgi:hypothetical protein
MGTHDPRNERDPRTGKLRDPLRDPRSSVPVEPVDVYERDPRMVYEAGPPRREIPVHHEDPMTVGERRQVARAVATGTTTEALAGAAAIALAILALAGILPVYLAAIATIAAGAALLIEGLSLSGAFAKITYEGGPAEHIPGGIGGGLGVYTVGGAAGVALGILALLEVEPLVMLPVAALVMGASILLGGSARAELNLSELDVHLAEPRARRAMEQSVKGTTSLMLLCGIAAAVLGIVALLDAGATALTLSGVAMLVIGTATLFGGSALAGRMLTAARR